jgi:hypothetical protein
MRRSQGRRGIFEHAFAALGIMLFTFSGGLAKGGGQALQPVRWRKA